MTTTKYPDLSAFQAGTSIKGTPFAVFRATEGNWLKDAACAAFVAQAKELGIDHALYHFIEAGSSAESQAKFCHAIAGDTPLMLDFEPIVASAAGVLAVEDPGGMGHHCGSAWQALQAWLGSQHAAATVPGPANAPFVSKPGTGKALGFIDAYRKLGGVCHLLYFPAWYHQILGSQSLKPFSDRGMVLVSSAYPAGGYSADGDGWQPYGGMHPQVWQFTDSEPFAGRRVDFNAFRGTPGELAALMATGSARGGAANPVNGLSASARFTQIDVSWDALAGAEDYVVKARAGDETARQAMTAGHEVTLHDLRKDTGYKVSVWARPGHGTAAEVHVHTRKA